MSYQNRHQGQGRHGRQADTPDYSAMTQYYDANGNLKKEVFVDWPRQVAKSVEVSRTNMRRAYDFVAAMRFRIQMGEDPVHVIQPGMGKLSRFVQYQSGRDKTWEGAKNFFQAHINAVGNDTRMFEGFYQLFQSVMAYLRGR